MDTQNFPFYFRYGAFSFGTEREFVPENFGKGSPSVFRHVAVRGTALVRTRSR